MIRFRSPSTTHRVAERRWPKAVLLVAAALVLIAIGFRISPYAREALAWWEDDPQALAAMRLEKALTPSVVAAEIDVALAAEDPDLAASFLTLADQHGLMVAPVQRARVAEALKASEAPGQIATEFAEGFATGEATSLPGMAGILAGDVTAYGDLRDLWREGSKLWNGEPHDELVLGLATVGLGLTGLTVATAGGALPARSGLTLVKTARKAGKLSPALAARTARVLQDVVDLGALKAAAKSAARFNVTAAREAVQGAIRPAHLARLRGLADDGVTLYRRAGARAAQETLALAQNAGEVKKAARIAERYGSGTRAVLKVLGRSAFVLVGALVTLASWALTATLWLWAALAFIIALTRWLTRLLWPRRRRRKRRQPAGESKPRGLPGRLLAPAESRL
ncbi:hypothetical protein [Microvirga massiliensis]|uniref:hypothetical protein n=1 Tax=Microvirga massiliensis TaxID=1033741 RepID=UPI0006611B25|nr:hypothetical protein [Microvirga massiliensis]